MDAVSTSVPATGGTTPLTLANAVTETAAINAPATRAGYAATANTGLAYASFLIGQIDKASLTQYVVQEYGARFRAISPYVQDNWKVNSKLTLDLGLRYDFFPSFREVHDNMSFFNPNLANPITGRQWRAGIYRSRSQHLQLRLAGATTTSRTSGRASVWLTRSIPRRSSAQAMA